MAPRYKLLMRPEKFPQRVETLSPEAFWGWLTTHVNCMARCSSHGAVLFDHADFHWNLSEEQDGFRTVQLLRAKEIVSELFVPCAMVSFIHHYTSEEGDYVFDLVVEDGSSADIVAQFVMVHDYKDESEPSQTQRWIH